MAENEFLASGLLLLRGDGTIPSAVFEPPSPQIVKRKSEDIETALQNAKNSEEPIHASKRLKPNAESHNSVVDRKLACPFFKRNKHSTGISKGCMGPGWDALHRVKEHIYRRHMQPKPQGNQGLSSATDLAAHQRTSAPCELGDAHAPVTINQEQAAKLRSRTKSHPGTTAAAKWQSMYQILFPDDTHTPSPYFDESCGHCISTADSRLVNDYLEYQMQQLPSLVASELAAISDCKTADGVRAHVVDMLPRLSAKVLQDFQQSQRAHSSEGSQESTKIMKTLELEGNGHSATDSQPLITWPAAEVNERQSQHVPFDEYINPLSFDFTLE